VDELARTLRVSPLTVRRDLTALERDGALLRTHGGCLANNRPAVESVYHRRVAHHFELKRAIGQAAALEVPPRATLLINDGSTTFHLAARLGDRGPLSVYTNSIAMIAELSRFPSVELHFLGGRYQPDLHVLGGPLTERALESLDFDLVFLGADAVSPAGQCLALDLEAARTTQVMLRRGRRKILLADRTKVGAAGHAAYGTLRDFDLWITTAGGPPGWDRVFRTLTKLKEVTP